MIYLSSKNVFHRDLKPVNILINGKNPIENPSEEDQILLIDFGIAKL